MTDIMTEAELAELRALEAAATPGPWSDDARGHWGDMPRIYGDGFLIAVVGNAQPERGDFWNVDAKFIRAARLGVPRLLAMIGAERAEVARLREAARGQIVIVEAARQMQVQAERDLAAARMALGTRPLLSDLAAANYRAKTAERERDEARAENARLRDALEPFAALSDAAANTCCKVGDIGDSLIADDFRRARAALKGGNADA